MQAAPLLNMLKLLLYGYGLIGRLTYEILVGWPNTLSLVDNSKWFAYSYFRVCDPLLNLLIVLSFCVFLTLFEEIDLA